MKYVTVSYKVSLIFSLILSGYSFSATNIDELCVVDRKFLQEIILKKGIKEDGPVNVISLDGGGIRGVISAVFLDKLEEQTKKSIHQLFDLAAGTSTGAILALGLVTEVLEGEYSSELSNQDDTNIEASLKKFRKASDMVNIYKEFSKKVFPPQNIYLKALTFVPAWFFWTSQYSEKPLEDELKKIVGDIQLKDLAIPTVITSVDLTHNTLKLFRSYRAAHNDGENFYVKDIARATSAAPSYFPMKILSSVSDTLNNKSPRQFSLADGGMAANNPSLIALSESYNLYGGRPINLISIGTGKKSGYCHSPKDVPYINRAAPTIELLFDSQTHTTDSILENLSKSKVGNFTYIRIQVPLQERLMAALLHE